MPTVHPQTADLPLMISVTNAELDQFITSYLADKADPTVPVVWADLDAEVVVRPNLTRLALRPGLVLVEVTLDSDQTGAQPLVVPLAIGTGVTDATRQAVTDHTPRGHAGLAGRWGEILQQAVWNAVLAAGNKFLGDQRVPLNLPASTAVLGLYSDGAQLTFIGGVTSTPAQISTYYGTLRGNLVDSLDPYRLNDFELTVVNGVPTRVSIAAVQRPAIQINQMDPTPIQQIPLQQNPINTPVMQQNPVASPAINANIITPKKLP